MSGEFHPSRMPPPQSPSLVISSLGESGGSDTDTRRKVGPSGCLFLRNVYALKPFCGDLKKAQATPWLPWKLGANRRSMHRQTGLGSIGSSVARAHAQKTPQKALGTSSLFTRISCRRRCIRDKMHIGTHVSKTPPSMGDGKGIFALVDCFIKTSFAVVVGRTYRARHCEI